MAYLARHPGAADSEQGIHLWWLPEMGVELPRAAVGTALQGLLTDGELTVDPLPDGSQIFRRAQGSGS